MKKFLAILFLASLLFTSCSEEDVVKTSNTVKIDGKSYKMPIITKNVDKLKSYLKGMTDRVLVSRNGDTYDITATMKNGEKDLFSTIHYVLTVANGNFQSLSVTYKYNPSKNVDAAGRKAVSEYIKKNSSISL